jgi:hypothetical protein
MALACLLPSDAARAEEKPSLFSDSKTWASLPHPEEKVPFAEANNNPDGFLGAFDPPPQARVRAGWFGEFGAAVMSPRFAKSRSANVLDAASNRIGPTFPNIFPVLETVGIDRAYGPEVAFGYRTPGVGELQIRYQGVYAEESEKLQVVPGFPYSMTNSGIPIDQILQLNALTTTRYRTRFRTHAADAIVSTDTLPVGEGWDFKLGGGVRFATFFLEDRGESKLITQSARNTFEGLGPLVGFDLNRRLLRQEDGFLAWIHTRVEGSYLFGDANHTLEETFSAPVVLIPPKRIRTTVEQSAPRVAAEIGFSFADLPTHHVRGTVGYRYDRWFEVGKSGGWDFDLVMQGAFVRVEWNY